MHKNVLPTTLIQPRISKQQEKQMSKSSQDTAPENAAGNASNSPPQQPPLVDLAPPFNFDPRNISPYGPIHERQQTAQGWLATLSSRP
jgi:hypothetical protein